MNICSRLVASSDSAAGLAIAVLARAQNDRKLCEGDPWVNNG